MEISYLLRGLVLGFSIAAPVGPIGVLCIRRTLSGGLGFGLASGLGAATADAAYGLIAGLGLTLISSFLVGQQVWLRLIGGAFLCYLALKTGLSQPGEREAGAGAGGLLTAWGSTFLLTLTNPMTILSFVAVFAGLGLGGSGNGYATAVLLVLGVFGGSALWWLTLASMVSRLRSRLSTGSMVWINRVSGLVIGAFGVIALAGALR